MCACAQLVHNDASCDTNQMHGGMRALPTLDAVLAACALCAHPFAQWYRRANADVCLLLMPRLARLSSAAGHHPQAAVHRRDEHHQLRRTGGQGQPFNVAAIYAKWRAFNLRFTPATAWPVYMVKLCLITLQHCTALICYWSAQGCRVASRRCPQRALHLFAAITVHCDHVMRRHCPHCWLQPAWITGTWASLALQFTNITTINWFLVSSLEPTTDVSPRR
jgi:hypothetical protein